MLNRTLRRAFLLSLICCLILPNQALAHSVLMDSTPGEGEIVVYPVEMIELRFDTRIEPISTIEIVSNNGSNIEVAKIEVDHDTLLGYLANPLQPGVYTVSWKIVGLDGHLVEGQMSFESAYEPEANDGSEDDEVANENATNNTESPEDDTANQEQANDDANQNNGEEENTPIYTEQENPLYSIVFTLFGVVALALIYRLWVKRRAL